MEIQYKISLVAISQNSYFDDGEKVIINIFTDKGEVWVLSAGDISERYLYVVDPERPPSGFVKYYPIDKILTIEEWKVWEDDLGRKNKKSVIHHFEKVEMINE